MLAAAAAEARAALKMYQRISIHPSMLKTIDAILEGVASPIYFWLLIFIYVFYISAALGVWYVYPEYLHNLTNFTQIFVALVLLWRFNPLRKNTRLHEFDERFITASACFLLVNAGLAGFLHNLVDRSYKLDSQ